MEKRNNPVIEIIEAIEAGTTKLGGMDEFMSSLDIDDKEKSEAINYCEKKYNEGIKAYYDLESNDHGRETRAEMCSVAFKNAIYNDVLKRLDKEYIIKFASHRLSGKMSRYDISDAIAYGADVNAKDKDGNTAIDLLRKEAKGREMTFEENRIMSMLVAAQTRALHRKIAENRLDEEEKLNKGRKEGEKRKILPKMSKFEKIKAIREAKKQLGG